jgi:hypothetical protein
MSDDLKARLRDFGHVDAYQAAARIEQLEAENAAAWDKCEERRLAQEALELALTRANAATAAAYEVAGRAIMEKCHDDMDRKEEAAIVRALATPDQNAALDAVRAEAQAQGMRIAVTTPIEQVPEAILAAIKGAKA